MKARYRPNLDFTRFCRFIGNTELCTETSNDQNRGPNIMSLEEGNFGYD